MAARKKSVARRARHFAAYAILRVLWAVLTRLPESALRILARLLGGLLAMTPLRAQAERHVRLAYGDTPPSEKFPTADALARACLHHYAMTLMEVVLLDRWQPRLLEEHCAVPAGMTDMVREVVARGRGVVVATGHLGNWELLGRGAARSGFDTWSLAKAPFDERVAAFLQEWRARGGVKTANRGSTRTLHAVREHLGRGGGLGALVDVDTAVKSAWVPFFGRVAKTPTAAADLALKFDATLVVLWSWRERFGMHSAAFVEIPLDRTGDHDADVERLTLGVTRELEAAIRRHPEQWIWTHRRWKSKPPTA